MAKPAELMTKVTRVLHARACPEGHPSRPPCLLFLGLSLCVFRAAVVRGRLAKGSDSLQAACQLQQQGDELGRKRV